MKERALAFLLACGALLLFWMLLFPKPPPRADDAARPLSFATGPTGYAGLSRWLAAEGVHVTSLRQRFERLTDAAIARRPTGNLLIVSLPEAIAVRSSEGERLDEWLRAGNSVLFIAGLDDTPAWDEGSAGGMPARLQRFAHVEFALQPDKDAAAALGSVLLPASPQLQPVASHPVNAGVTAIVTRSDLPSSRWRAQATDEAPVVVLARRADTGQPAVWLRPLGLGSIIVSAWASPFANAQLGQRDNARWLAQLVAWTLDENGTVIFDDMHQGASEYYDPQRFFADPRLHHTLWWIVGLWFVYVLGARPLLAARAARPALDDTSMLRVTGGFLAHVLRPADAARRMFALFFNELRRRRSLPENGEPLWDWLAAHARVEPAQLEQLRELHARAVRGRRVDLIRLQNSLLDLTGRLS